MAIQEPSFIVGIEEEYLLVDRESGSLASDPPESLMEDCVERLGDQVSPEFLRSQVEVGTVPCSSVAEARNELARLRKGVAEAASVHSLLPIAASTHPLADHDLQPHTEKERYEILARDLQAVARRLLISGMHVHVEILNEDLRIDLMSQVTYFLPHLLALSTSSPYWRGRDTGLMSYRVAVWDELPRTGLPDSFESWSEYRILLTTMCDAGIIEDGTKLWWDVRPSDRYPTLEMRICDVTPKLDDAICIASLFMCILRMLYRLRAKNQRWRRYSDVLINENRWRAQRYGIDEPLVDYGIGEMVPYADLFEELLELINEDMHALCCREEVLHGREILARGTSAHRQRKVFGECIEAGASREEALTEVVRMLASETVQDL